MQRIKVIILSIIIAGSLLGIAVQTVSAQGSPTRTQQAPAQTEVETEAPESQSTRQNVQRRDNIEERKEVSKERLKDANLSTCKNREQKINTIMDRVNQRSQSHVDRISQVSERAQDFYDKAGNDLANYGELVADVNAKKTLALSAVDTLSGQANFTCESDGPKSDLQLFRNNRLTKVQAVSDYRNAVRALLAGIKLLQPTETPVSTGGQR